MKEKKMPILRIAAAAVLLSGLLACQTKHDVKVEPVEVKPIHITIDVNVRVEKALDDFFSDIDQAAEKIEVKGAEPTEKTEKTGKTEKSEKNEGTEKTKETEKAAE